MGTGIRAPAPFVVGVPRSGTTLLRLQLDAHPQLAIPPETGWALAVADEPSGPAELAARLRALETWPDAEIGDAELDAVLTGVDPWSTGEGLRALYRAYARRHGKPRWGDKTPLHLEHLPRITELLPEAHVVHIIRDGRDVAVSLRPLPFAPGDGSIEAIAAAWRDQIACARSVLDAVPHYREIRYEALVADPAGVLAELCDWLELPFDPAMLRAHERAAERLAEGPDVRASSAGMITRESRMAIAAHTSRPPDPARAGRWRAELTDDEVARFEAIGAETLMTLSYPLAGPAPPGLG